ncbi:MAG: hypothetical protein EP343_30085 [Deltaproteobacteria bacterium]|nr:MAG: hypothetical protein EP343_30085 [Deltaproteobacteria bacterium]
MLLCLLGLAMGLCGCPNEVKLESYRPPQGKVREQITWMRTTFYELYKIEQKRQDGSDLLRRFIKQHRKLAMQTFQRNAKSVEQRRISGKKLRNLERFYLLMNVLIRESLALSKTKKPKQRP